MSGPWNLKEAALGLGDCKEMAKSLESARPKPALRPSSDTHGLFAPVLEILPFDPYFPHPQNRIKIGLTSKYCCKDLLEKKRIEKALVQCLAYITNYCG